MLLGPAFIPLVALGVKAPFAAIRLGRLFVGAMRVLSRCVEDADDSLAESGLVGCLSAVSY